MPIKTVEIRVRSRTQRVEVGGGLPGSPGQPGADGADGQDGVSVTGASINGSGHLILTLSSGGPIDVGYVVGPQGEEGEQGPAGNDGTDGTDGTDGVDGISITNAVVNGSGDLIITLSNGGTINAGDVIGPVGPDGDPGTDGVSITGATVDGSYNLILSLSTGGTINAGYVRGPAGAGTGDVLGPASSTTGNFASYGNGTGKLIADSGLSAASFATAAQGTKADSALQPAAIGVSVQAYDAELAALAGLTSAADRLPYFTGSGTAGLATFTTFGRSLVDDADASAARTTLGLVIGTNVQAYDAELAAIAGLTSAADRLPYFTGSGTASLATFTTFGRSIVDDADASAARTTLGLAIGTNVQAWDADLDAVAALATNGLISKTGAGTVAGRTIGGTANQVAVADGDGISGNPTVSLDPSDIRVPAVITAPNTGLHILDTDASHDLIMKPGSNLTADRTMTFVTGDADRQLTLNSDVNISAFAATFLDDADAASVKTTLGIASSDSWVLLETVNPSASAGVTFTSSISTAFDHYMFVFENLLMTNSTVLRTTVSIDGGANFLSTGYQGGRTQFNGGSAIAGASFSGTFDLLSMTGTNAKLSGLANLFLYNDYVGLTGQITHGTIYTICGGQILAAGARPNSIRIAPGAGTFTGTIKLFGVRK